MTILFLLVCFQDPWPKFHESSQFNQTGQEMGMIDDIFFVVTKEYAVFGAEKDAKTLLNNLPLHWGVRWKTDPRTGRFSVTVIQLATNLGLSFMADGLKWISIASNERDPRTDMTVRVDTEAFQSRALWRKTEGEALFSALLFGERVTTDFIDTTGEKREGEASLKGFKQAVEYAKFKALQLKNSD